MKNIVWYIVGAALLMVAVMFGWMKYDLSKRGKVIEQLRAETSKLEAAVQQSSVERDVAVAKCKVLEIALQNAKKSEKVESHTGKITTVTVLPTGETTTVSQDPSVTITEIVSNPTLPPNTVINEAPAAPMVKPVVNTVFVGYNTPGTWSLSYLRDFRRFTVGAGINTAGEASIYAGTRF